MASKNQPLHNTIAELWRSVRIDNIKVESVGGQDSPRSMLWREDVLLR